MTITISIKCMYSNSADAISNPKQGSATVIHEMFCDQNNIVFMQLNPVELLKITGTEVKAGWPTQATLEMCSRLWRSGGGEGGGC